MLPGLIASIVSDSFFLQEVSPIKKEINNIDKNVFRTVVLFDL